MGDMEYVPNPTFQMDTEQSSPTTATTITSPVQVEEESRPGQLTVQDKAGGSRRSDHSPSPRTPASDKRNKSWYYSSMYPSYKTRRKEFRNLFPMVGTDSRFVVDYSCAYHKDILHQGRMYVTTNSCCFYSYIFGWENKVVVDWSDVTSITKEKTAIFIPNAVQITAKDNKYFFASFVERDSSYMMLFRLWQAALANQLLSDEDIDQIIACEYGEGDEDEEDDSECPDTGDEVDSSSPTTPVPVIAPIAPPSSAQPVLSTWLSTCEGTTVCDKTFPRPLEQLYRLLYSNDNFYFNFQKERGTTELEIGDWELEDSGRKVREVSYNMALNNPVGPKKCQVKETQTLSQDNIENQIYCIETTADNSGVPYADSFSVVTHSCLVDAGNNTARLVARAEIRFKKDLWGFLKDKIETNAWSGIKSYYSSLSSSLESYSETAPQQASMQARQARIARRSGRQSRRDWPAMTTLAWNIITQPLLLYMVMLFLLVTSVINTAVLYRLASMSPSLPPPPAVPFIPPLQTLPTDQAGWLALLSKQAELHSVRSSHMRQQLLSATEHIARAEHALEMLREGLNTWQPYAWVEGDANCVNKDGKLVCDQKEEVAGKDEHKVKDEM
eukprot:TRINITY_DN12152_c0_g1_i1.p1 TRINITY_DN12152_c0_g1~~TRINITY_DN12152_c0_g1_i1.p1  ORF type:complete len:613 (-),score=240.81 TRINITY_DN12152_c0_g1_i1:371-2209(-)